eukprot:1850094-Heterocapsa_arctica.AAC.1
MGLGIVAARPAFCQHSRAPSSSERTPTCVNVHPRSVPASSLHTEKSDWAELCVCPGSDLRTWLT